MTSLAETLQTALQHHQAGRLQQAEQIYRQILHADARHADALHLLGVVAYQRGRYEEAIREIKAAIALTPSCAAYHNNLGLAFRAARKLLDAQAAHEQAQRLDPSYAAAHANLGYVLRELSRLPAALACYEQAVRLQPGFADAHHGLGKVLQDLGRLPEALASHDEAIRLQPGFADAHHYRGEILEDLGRLPEALASYRQAVHCQPNHVEARHSAGQVLEELGQVEEARQWWEQPLRTATDDGAKIRAVLSTPAVFMSVEQMQRQRQHLLENLALLEEQHLSLDDPLTQVGVTNFGAAYHGLNDRCLQAHLAALYGRAAPSLSYIAAHCRRSDPENAGRPLRVGFVSSFFHSHTIGEVNLGLIRNLSRQVCRVILFPFPCPDDPIAGYIQNSADEVVPLPAVLDRARKLIAEQKLDVLFYTDIGMDPLTYFLAFARLAPVQCVTWGHPVTTGIPTIDYYLSSEYLEPSGAEDHYTERLVKLRGLPTFYYAPAFMQPAKTRSQFGLAEDEHLYLCPQAPFKVHPDYDPILGEILRSDPRGRVLFIRSQNPTWTHQLLRRFHRALPDVVDRIQFLPHQGGQDYLHLLAVCDVLLDTTHFGGGNTTYKAFSVGAPIVTLPGAVARGRVTAACYRKMGVLDCIAADRTEYVQIALRLGADREWRAQVCSRIRGASAVLYEDTGVLRELEQFFVEAVRRTQIGGPRPNSSRIQERGAGEPRSLLIQSVMGSPPCNRVRVLEPNQFLATIPGTRTHATGPEGIDLNLGQPGEEKVFIWQRAALTHADGLRLHRTLLSKGYLIVAEMDDDPQHWPAHADNIAFTLRSCHCVQTSTEPLAQVFRTLTAHVAVFPNQLAQLPPPRTYDEEHWITLFFGAWGREDDWAPIMPALNRVLAARQDRVRVRVIHDRGFFAALKTDNKEWEPACPFERYQEILSSCDIGLLPLNPIPKNARKSDLKFLECAGHGVAALASPTVYEGSIVNGQTGLLYRSAEEFEGSLTTLIEDQSFRRQLTARAYDWVSKCRLLSQHYKARHAWYLHMRDRLPELNKELRQRVPELFS